MKKILIFGATGTVGAYSALYLKDKGYDIIASGRRKSDNGFFHEHGIQYFSVNISNKNEFSTLDGMKPDVILHCAGIMPATMREYYPQQYIDSILTGTLNVLEYARIGGVKKMLFTQSHADSKWLMETQKPIPADIEKKFPLTGDHAVYAICKNAAVDLIEHYFYEYGIQRFVFRLPTIYAYHPNPFFYVNGKKKWIAYRLLIEQAIRGATIEVWGNAERKKEITYIGDLCQIFERAIESELNGGMYNVGRGIGVSLEEQIRGIVEVFCNPEKKSQIIYSPEKPDAPQFIHDISKTQQELGYQPEYDYQRLLLAFKNEMCMERFAGLWGKKADFPLEMD
ncbi:MAG: NAD(P)-dependent oxidoreductase [Spirochaetaceae bacterium]|jgi:UDP-glucose 4-epimerase|nr:NAD(P)-dependent oxidoreductase [Spirochaetaceae bacterium]